MVLFPFLLQFFKAHNGNITNTDELTIHLSETAGRHINTDSDSELLLNLFAESLTVETKRNKASNSDSSCDGATTKENMETAVFAAMQTVMEKCHGGYAGLYLINGYGLVGFRDPNGIRPLVFGCRKNPNDTSDNMDDEGIPVTPACMDDASSSLDYVIASESVAIDTLGFSLVRYVFLS